ncbi:hypothetical protein AMK68_00270 [candidate division KD3-62 bacterium DG_56]|uniref:Uncharacterized protein n=1 Tax=candidate division KD3-62 bacterium DG_56 TaxID=1704032 RepID=A0A0S7XRA1_9BACT|nr:MAG: hypothetical protein AMK68_00270 [candidate division KD3-62 bacterium DG_56]
MREFLTAMAPWVLGSSALILALYALLLSGETFQRLFHILFPPQRPRPSRRPSHVPMHLSRDRPQIKDRPPRLPPGRNGRRATPSLRHSRSYRPERR